ncbi:MAG: hypothetical protein WB439_13760, partial [Acidobacteriaceae bacterium]
GIHLPNTVRSRNSGRDLEEKMVDTALSADVVATAYRERADWIMVVTEDDDLIPATYIAEAVLDGSGAQVVLLRQRSQTSMMDLGGILRTG